jgi:hypothetical protein
MKKEYIDRDHSYWLDGIQVPSVTQILTSEGFYNFTGVNSDLLERSSEFGKAVHETCRLWDMGILDVENLSLPLVPHLSAWKKFREAFGIEFIPELMEEHKINEKYRFGFCPDRVTKTFILIDIKSSETPSPVAGLQTAGYKIGAEAEGYKINKRWAVHLHQDGNYSIQKYEDIAEESIFLMALQCYYWKQRRLNRR